MSTPTRDHVRIDGADALLDQITAALAGPDMAAGVLGQIGDRLARGAATLDLAAARRTSISSGRSVVIAHRPGGPALAVRWFAPGCRPRSTATAPGASRWWSRATRSANAGRPPELAGHAWPKNTTWWRVTSSTGGRLPATCTASRAPAPAR